MIGHVFAPTQVADCELTSEVPAVPHDTPPRRLEALVRWHGIPLGRVQFAPRRAPISPSAVADALTPAHQRTLFAQRLRAALARPRTGPLLLRDIVAATPARVEGRTPLVTIAVCTRERADELALCLDALLRLDYPALDLLVIDNAPRTDATRSLVSTRFPSVRYTLEPRPGLDRARNRAILEARGEILAFTDDDTMVDRHWIRAIVNVFESDPAVDAVTGLVVPFELETEAQAAFEEYGGFARGFERRWHSFSKRDRSTPHHIGAGHYGTGANMAFRRAVFAQIGEFDPTLDVGTPTDGGGDLDIFFRVLEHEKLLVYEPAAIVRHRHRRSLRVLRGQIMTWGTGFYAFLLRNARFYPERRADIISFGLLYIWSRYIRGVLAGAHAPWSLQGRLRVREAWGMLLSPYRYWKSCAAARRIDAN